jgi:hypothetical protein
VPFDTWPVLRRVLVIAAVALVGAGGFALARQESTPPPASHTDVYTQLAQQLKRHLRPLVVAKTVIKNHAPMIQVPQQQGYSCELASGNGCSLHPCVKYVQSVGELAVAATAGRCNRTAKAAPRAVPIVAP